MTLEKKQFTNGGLNTDDEARLLAPNDYRYALNVRSGSAEDADVGSITNTKGNTLISFDLPTGTNKSMGTYEDKKNKRLLYLVYNSNTDHQILEYDISSNSISLILQSEFIALDSSSPISHINLIDDKLLHWVDNFGDPHKLNIDRAKKPLNSILPVADVTDDAGKAMLRIPSKFTITYSIGDNVLLLKFTNNSYNGITTITQIKKAGIFNHITINKDFIGTEPGGALVRTIQTIDGYPNPFKKQYLDAAVYPSLCAPTAQYKDDPKIRTNSLRGTLFQFKIQYIYTEAEKSAWSPISKLPLPDGEEKFANAQYMPETENNMIEIRLNTGDELVKKINIAARMGNDGDFFLIDTLDKDTLDIASNAIADYNFYNDGIYSTIDVKESNKLFDRVPRKAATQEFIDGNKLTYGNILEDFDPVNIDMKITPIYNTAFVPSNTPQPIITIGGRVGNYPTIDPDDDDLGYQNVLIDYQNSIANAGSLFTLVINYKVEGKDSGAQAVKNSKNFSVFPGDIGGDTVNYTYTVKQDDNINDVLLFFANEINNDTALIRSYQSGTHHGLHIGEDHHPHVSTSTARVVNATVSGSLLQLIFNYKIRWYYGVDSPEWNDPSYFGFYTDNINNDSTKIFEAAPIKRAFKRGANHEFGIAYFDFANRSGHVNKSKDTSVYVEFFTETTEKGRVDMDIEINHKPPEWATNYQLYYTKNQTTEAFIQGWTDIVTTKGSDIITLILSLDHILIKYKEDNQNSILNFIPKPGDRIRFMKDRNGTYFSSLIDMEILAFDSGTAKITIPTPPSGVVIEAKTFFEIYSPKKEIKEKFYYEIGECYGIGDAGLNTRYHKGYQNQITGTLPAIIQLRNEGDVYYKGRFLRDPAQVIVAQMVEEFNFSDFYLSAYINIGRINIHDLNIKEIRRPNVIYYSEIFIPDSNINGLGSIFGDSFKEYDQNYGSIQKLYTEDKRLICFQELKVGMILINESVIFDQTGKTTIQKSQQVLSDIIYYTGEFGIGREPGSFAVYGKRKYFTDVDRGAVLRLSQDGITPISENKMHNHFTDRFKDIKENGEEGGILGIYDIKFREYILSTKISKRINSTVIRIRPHTHLLNRYEISVDDTSIFNVGDRIDFCYFEINEERDRCDVATVLTISETSIWAFLEVPVVILVGSEIIVKVDTDEETIAFNEPLNKWVTFYSYQPEMMSEAGMDIVTFKDGKLYKHNDNVIYNNFYGTQYESIIDFIANENPSSVKFFLGIEEESTDIWTMPRATNLNGQQTSLIKEDFENIEEVFWAAFFKDENSNGGLLEGEDMRSSALSVRLKNDSTIFQKLFSIGIRSELSQRTNV